MWSFPERETIRMNDSKKLAADETQIVLAEYIGENTFYADDGPDQGLNQLEDLTTYLEETYEDDEVLKALLMRAWAALANHRSGPLKASKKGLLERERARVERWMLYLEGKGDPAGGNARRLWNGLDACFDPSTGQLEKWFANEAKTLKELRERYEGVPEGEAQAIFN